jgi:hypothetical protein
MIQELLQALRVISERDPQSDTCGPKAPEDCECGCIGCIARTILVKVSHHEPLTAKFPTCCEFHADGGYLTLPCGPAVAGVKVAEADCSEECLCAFLNIECPVHDRQ